MVDNKLLNDVIHQYFLDVLSEGIKRNEYTSKILKKMTDDGLSEEEACNIMIYAYLNHDRWKNDKSL